MLFASIIAFTFSALIVSVILYFVKDIFVKKGYYGVDVHKPAAPKVAEMGGIVSSLVVIFALAVTYFFIPLHARGFLDVFLSVFLFYTMLGLIDDLRGLRSRIKLPSSLFGGVLVVVLSYLFDARFYDPRPPFPFVGEVHNAGLFYVILVPVALAVTSNAFNMYDVYNGTLAFAATVNFLTLGVLVLLAGVAYYSALVSYFSFLLAGVSFGLYVVNRYPAKFFLGDTGSLSLGAAYGLIAVSGRLEVVSAVAILPMLMNGFLSFSSVGRIFERHEVKQRPVMVNRGYISANPNIGAPMSIAHILTSMRPLTEKEVILRYNLLTLLGTALAIITFFLTPW
jgi:UDP-N-acetylmuramyl pentapeptide phosphotransferase/UDP-N-acetylglucosamine-1-phosphate transferase